MLRPVDRSPPASCQSQAAPPASLKTAGYSVHSPYLLPYYACYAPYLHLLAQDLQQALLVGLGTRRLGVVL